MGVNGECVFVSVCVCVNIAESDSKHQLKEDISFINTNQLSQAIFLR